jgi:hypothetical protein
MKHLLVTLSVVPKISHEWPRTCCHSSKSPVCRLAVRHTLLCVIEMRRKVPPAKTTPGKTQPIFCLQNHTNGCKSLHPCASCVADRHTHTRVSRTDRPGRSTASVFQTRSPTHPKHVQASNATFVPRDASEKKSYIKSTRKSLSGDPRNTTGHCSQTAGRHFALHRPGITLSE